MISQFVEILSGLLTAIAGGVSAYIAFQYWRSDKLKVNHDRRLRIFDAAHEILVIGAAGGADLTDEQLQAFLIKMSEVDIDDPEIKSYLEKIYTYGVQLQYLKKKTDPKINFPVGHTRDEMFDNLEKEIHWFGGQIEPAKEKFRKYLNIGSV